jgi:hypothetical protein
VGAEFVSPSGTLRVGRDLPTPLRASVTSPCSCPGSGLARAEVVEDVDVVVAVGLARYSLAGLPEPHGLAADTDKITDFVKGRAGADADRAPPGWRRQLPIRLSLRQGSPFK